jgi:hypothetical protein
MARRFRLCGPFGGLLWIYQEVVTLRVLIRTLRVANFGELRVLAIAISGATYAGRQSYSPVELRSTQSNRSKSQPPHLVYGYINYCQNLSSDHLLSGVVAE